MGGGFEQAWPDRIEAAAVACRQLLVAVGGAQVGEAGERLLRAAVAEVAEGFQRAVVVALAEPDAGQRMFAALGVGENRLKVLADPGAVRVELGQQGVPVGKAHVYRDAFTVTGVARQHVGLFVLDILQAVFEAAQENVGGAQFLLGVGRNQLALDQALQHRQGRANLQAGVAAATDQLENLGHELDFANPAGAELDVVGLVLARDFTADLGVQVAHRVDRAEIEVFAEDEGA